MYFSRTMTGKGVFMPPLSNFRFYLIMVSTLHEMGEKEYFKSPGKKNKGSTSYSFSFPMLCAFVER